MCFHPPTQGNSVHPDNPRITFVCGKVRRYSEWGPYPIGYCTNHSILCAACVQEDLGYYAEAVVRADALGGDDLPTCHMCGGTID